MDTFVVGLSFLIPFGVIAIIIFAIAGLMEGKGTMKKGPVIRSLYFYLTSLVTLAIVVGSLVFLLTLGFKTWVFPKADEGNFQLGAPPTLYLESPGGVSDVAKPVPAGSVGLTCEGECTLTDTQKSSIESWVQSYTTWRETFAHPGSRQTRDAVSALSFLIIALPFFLIHFRIVQKDARQSEESEQGVIRPTYFYFISLASLLMIVIAGGFLINITLKTWVFPEAGKADELASKVYATQAVPPEDGTVKSIATCGEKCGLSQETIDLAKQWQTDYTAWQKDSGTFSVNNRERQASTAIPFVALGIPLFWYHWALVRRESRSARKDNTEVKA